MTPLRLALLSLLRRRLPSLMALVAIALPVATGGVLWRLDRLSAQRFVTLDRSFDAVVGAKTGELALLLGALNGEGPAPDALTYNLYASIRERAVLGDAKQEAQPFLRQLIPLTIFARYQGHKVMATDSAYWQRAAASPVFLRGGPPQVTGEAVISAHLAAKEQLHLGDAITAEVWVRNIPEATKLPSVPLKIVGITADTGLFWDEALLTDMAEARHVLGSMPDAALHPVWREKVVHYMLANCLPGGCERLDDLVNHATIAQMVDVKEQLRRLRLLLGTSERIGLATSLLILVLGVLAVGGMMMTRFDAMRSQLAVLRAIGYGRRDLVWWLLLEGLLLGSGAVCLGAVLDALSLPWLQEQTQANLGEGARLTVPVLASAPVWAAALLASTLAACLPLFMLYRQDVHRALRSY